ncbi:MAG: nuclear transport factor 2 family protein [Thermodesulfobacteriota bacterium]
MALTPEVRAEVRITLESMLEAYGRGDLDEVMSYYLEDDSIVGFGTGADERNLGWQEHRAQIQRDLAQSNQRQVVLDWFKADGLGEVAWAAVECSAWAQTEAGEFRGRLRGSFVLVKRGRAWKIVLSHASLPLASQAEGQSFPST